MAKKKTSPKNNNQKLADAIKDGNLESVKKLIEQGADVNNTDEPHYGRTPLIIACSKGYIEIVKTLIIAGADVNKKGRRKETPLLAACDDYDRVKPPEIVELLLKNNADPELYNKGEDGPLHYAAMYGRTEAVKLLVNYGAKINVKGAYGRTPLIYAASESPEMVQFLIDHGADIKATNNSKENALFELISDEDPNTEIAQILIDSGIDIHLVNDYHGTALHWAAFCGRKNIIELLLKNGADINQKNKRGEPPIVRAMSRNYLDIVKFLFELGADPDFQSSFSWTLLEFAVENNDKEFVKKILKKLKKKRTTGALATAARDGNLEMVKLLIESGIHVDEWNTMGNETPLMKAAYHNHMDVVKYLLNKGADIKARDSRKNTALLHAAWSGNTEIVKYLLENGAEINERNYLNWNALMQACIEGHFETAKVLLENGSPTDEIDKEKGATALTLAKHSGNKHLVTLLVSYGASERAIKKRKENEDYFLITDCEICEYLAHKKDLARSRTPETFKGLELIYSQNNEPDRYTSTSKMIKRCTNCGTYYHHHHLIDTEDAFIGGPYISQNFQRYTLTRLKKTLTLLGKQKELKEVKKLYPALLEKFIDLVQNKTGKIKPNIMPYIIESITDFYILSGNWDNLQSVLLSHPNPDIALDTAEDLILIYGETCRKGCFPCFTHYRDFTEEIQELTIALIKAHRKELKECILQYTTHSDKRIKKLSKKRLESGIFYKVFK